MTPAAQADTYAKQALRFARFARCTGKQLVREFHAADRDGDFEALRDIRIDGGSSLHKTVRDARRYAAEAARHAREMRAYERRCGRNTVNTPLWQEKAADAAVYAAKCAGYARRVERSRP